MRAARGFRRHSVCDRGGRDSRRLGAVYGDDRRLGCDSQLGGQWCIYWRGRLLWAAFFIFMPWHAPVFD
jgi:hypothetical protein